MKQYIEVLKSLNYLTVKNVENGFEKGIVPLYEELKSTNKLNKALKDIFSKLNDELKMNVINEINLEESNKTNLHFFEDTLRLLTSKNPYKLSTEENVELDIDIAETNLSLLIVKESLSTKYRQYMRALVKLLIFHVELG